MVQGSLFVNTVRSRANRRLCRARSITPGALPLGAVALSIPGLECKALP